MGVLVDIAEKVIYFVVSVHFIPIAVGILALVLYLVFSKIHQHKVFYERETVRHMSRTDFAIKQLVNSPYTDRAFAALAWSQSDLMSVFAQRCMSKEQKQSLGGLYALALNVPLQHAKRTLFTEKPRCLKSRMDERTAEKIQGAIENLVSSGGSNVKLSASLFNIIAYNQLVYYPSSPEHSDIHQKDFYCVHPCLLPNEEMRDSIRRILSDTKQSLAQIAKVSKIHISDRTAYEVLRGAASFLQRTTKWKLIYERDEETGNFDPRVSFVLKVISFLAHMIRSRPCYLLEDDFQKIHRVFLDSITAIFETCEKLLELKDEDFGASTNMYTRTCESLSENLLVIYDLLGLHFAFVSSCAEGQEDWKSIRNLPLGPKVFKRKFWMLKRYLSTPVLF